MLLQHFSELVPHLLRSRSGECDLRGIGNGRAGIPAAYNGRGIHRAGLHRLRDSTGRLHGHALGSIFDDCTPSIKANDQPLRDIQTIFGEQTGWGIDTENRLEAVGNPTADILHSLDNLIDHRGYSIPKPLQ